MQVRKYASLKVLKSDMEKHSSSLAVLAEFFQGFGGNIFQWLPLFCDDFGGKQRKVEIIWEILLLFNQNQY